MIIGIGLLVSSVMVRTRDLVIPLWMGRQLIRWSGFNILVLIFLGYALVQRGLNQDEQRKLFLDYQQKLELDKQ